MDVLWHDLRHTLRSLRRQPSFTGVIILTLAVGIGANTAVFTLLHSTILAPLPYREPDRLAMIWTEIPSQGVREATSAYANIQDWRTQNRTFDDLATFDPTTLTMTDGAWPEQLSTARVSANLFDVLGIGPALGRSFSAEEEQQRAPVVVLGHELWQRRFNGSRGAIGRTLEIAGTQLEVVGIMPEHFGFPDRATQLWLPQTLFTDWAAAAARRGTDAWRVIGRLRATASLDAARADMQSIAARLEQQYPADNAGLGTSVVALDVQVTGQSFRVALWTLFGAVALVLLIACANVAHLLLARAIDRARELALRRALGATTRRLVRQAVTENVILAIAAAVAGVLLASGALRLLVALAPADLPRLDDVAIDTTVLLYAAVVSLLAGVLLGAAPALSAARDDLFANLRERVSMPGTTAWRARNLLIVLQFALAIILVFGANLLVRSFIEARRVDSGMDTGNVLMANLSVEEPSRRVTFYEQLLQEVQAIPGVRAAGIIEDLFISGAPNRAIAVEGRIAEGASFEQIRIDAIEGDFFQALGAQLREGREFTGSDGAGAPPVAIINETMARRFWPGESPVGRRFSTTGDAAGPWIEIVGVSRDMRRQGLEREPIAQVFRPYAQEASRNMNLLIASDLPAATLTATVRERIAAIDRTVPLYSITTVADALDRFLLQRRFQTFMLGLFSAIALVLAAIGIYGVIRYSVTRRAHDIGVRIALGASSGGITRMVIRQSLALALPGLAIGVLGALWLADSISSLLFGTSTSDPANILVPAAILLGSAVLAAWGPARRAARIDPMTVLRSQ